MISHCALSFRQGSTADRHIVALNDIQINILDFLVPKKCSDAEFRRSWAILEWENTVSSPTRPSGGRNSLLSVWISGTRQVFHSNLPFQVMVKTPIKDMRVFIDHIAKSARMGILTDDAILKNDCGFVAANFYTRSLFEEEAVANVSLIRNAEGDLEGQIRVRAQSQGVARRLGDKLKEAQNMIPKQIALNT